MSNKMGYYLALLIFIYLGYPDRRIQNFPIDAEEILEPTWFNAEDTLEIDLTRSKIFWKGTKMRGLGKHEGEIEILGGFLLIENNRILGGEIDVNMHRISVTDIPESDPIPIKNLTNHLKGPDFFDVENYPLSHLSIRSVQLDPGNKILLTGSLTIKGITNSISFEVKKLGMNHFTTNLEFDRFDWDIAYSGSWADRTLVDREIVLRAEILCK
ncbi:polyisoprenoid-binding protein YceI [Algoriphagus sp. 4150]|uniref:YceI family protein n=1 Tax=Algoriphagus sp. 4150 TaxID=2817756 RepID=UPI0028558AD1|nr:YceI family protein [Algoriphagus sp. 4150]MDR7128519.1 polyisoprenoid-binding protein YceI [Algoriphagus sp. 4150]